MAITLEQLKIKIKTDLRTYYGRRHEKPSNFLEVNLVKELSKALGGKVEVSTPIGRIDLLTDDFILEAKIAKYAKQSLGQLLCYEVYIKRPFHVLALIGEIPSYVPEICKHFDLILLQYNLNTYRWHIL